MEGEKDEQVLALTAQDRESLDNLAKVVQGVADTVAGLQRDQLQLQQSQRTNRKLAKKKGNGICWGCGKEGYQRKNCKTNQ